MFLCVTAFESVSLALSDSRAYITTYVSTFSEKNIFQFFSESWDLDRFNTPQSWALFKYIYYKQNFKPDLLYNIQD